MTARYSSLIVDDLRSHVECLLLFRFVGCLPSTTDMSAGHRRMRAGVVQIPMEETAECSGVAGTFSAMGIEEVGRGVGLTQRWGKAG
jgi:hypothetical protein